MKKLRLLYNINNYLSIGCEPTNYFTHRQLEHMRCFETLTRDTGASSCMPFHFGIVSNGCIYINASLYNLSTLPSAVAEII